MIEAVRALLLFCVFCVSVIVLSIVALVAVILKSATNRDKAWEDMKKREVW